MPENKSPMPASQKAPLTNTSNQTNVAGANKTTESGSIKDSQTGNTLAANQTTNREGVVTGDKTAKEESMTANTPTTKAIAEEERTKENAPNANEEPLDAGVSELKGEILQGDSFRITVTRGNKTLLIPVPVEGSKNVTILDNTFRIIKGIMEAKNGRELDDKFASFVQR
jgi:hypothetical protein